MCDCKLCKDHELFERMIKITSLDSREYWRDLYDELNHVKLDLDYANAVIDGSWPTADEIIKHTRKKRGEEFLLKVQTDPEFAKKFFFKVGFIDEFGNLTPEYGGEGSIDNGE